MRRAELFFDIKLYDSNNGKIYTGKKAPITTRKINSFPVLSAQTWAYEFKLPYISTDK